MKKAKRIAATALAVCAIFLPVCASYQSVRGTEYGDYESSEEGGISESFPESAPENGIVEPSVPPEEGIPTPPEENTPTIVPPSGEKPSEGDDAEEMERLYITCRGNGVNLRTGAGTGYEAAATAQKGEAYAVLFKKNGWYCVYYRGKKLYFSEKYAEEFRLKKSENEKTEAVLEEGYALLGTPYVYGAVRLHDGNGYFYKKFTTNAFDCSSLTQYVFYRGAKKSIGTTTRIQVKQGKFVKKSELSRGDCIYFTNATRYNNTGTERIGHVAIYLGDNYILHTSSDYARIEKLTAARMRYYVEARRFV